MLTQYGLRTKSCIAAAVLQCGIWGHYSYCRVLLLMSRRLSIVHRAGTRADRRQKDMTTPNCMVMCSVLFSMIWVSSATRAQQSNGTPQSDVAFIQSTQDSLITALRLKPANNSSVLNQQISNAGTLLNRYSGFSTPIWLCNGCGTSSHPTLGIIVDLDQLNAIKRRSESQNFSSIVFFLVAHEKAHQIQYRRYTASIINSSEADRQSYEAQADILGGKFLAQFMGGSNIDQQEEILLEALRVAYSLGVEQYAIADHPSQDARVTAVRLGIA